MTKMLTVHELMGTYYDRGFNAKTVKTKQKYYQMIRDLVRKQKKSPLDWFSLPEWNDIKRYSY